MSQINALTYEELQSLSKDELVSYLNSLPVLEDHEGYETDITPVGEALLLLDKLENLQLTPEEIKNFLLNLF